MTAWREITIAYKGKLKGTTTEHFEEQVSEFAADLLEKYKNTDWVISAHPYEETA